MKTPIVFLAAIALSTAVFADNMQQDTKSSDSMHSGIGKDATQAEVLKNTNMQRLHKEMTRNRMSERGMEARLDMMTEKGRAFHQALEQDQKNTAG